MPDGVRGLSIREVARTLGVRRGFAREIVGRRALASLRAAGRVIGPASALRAFAADAATTPEVQEASADGEV